MRGGRRALLGEGRVWLGGNMDGWREYCTPRYSMQGEKDILCQMRFLTQARSD